MQTEFPFTWVCWECGAPAFLVRKKLNKGDLIVAEDFAHLDGSPVLYAQSIECPKRGARLYPQGAYDRYLIPNEGAQHNE